MCCVPRDKCGIIVDPCINVCLCNMQMKCLHIVFEHVMSCFIYKWNDQSCDMVDRNTDPVSLKFTNGAEGGVMHIWRWAKGRGGGAHWEWKDNPHQRNIPIGWTMRWLHLHWWHWHLQHWSQRFAASSWDHPTGTCPVPWHRQDQSWSITRTTTSGRYLDQSKDVSINPFA